MQEIRPRHPPLRLVALWGDEHPNLGEIATEPIGDHTVIALSAGRLPKPYWHLDPNEDAVLAAEGSALQLLAVADGHNGIDAARAALGAVADRWEAVLGDRATPPTRMVAELMDVARDAVVNELVDLEPPRLNSRTALTLALVTPTHVHAATWGDTAAALVRPVSRWGRPRSARVDRDGPFLGPHADLPAVTSSRVKRGDVVVVASDGLTDYLPGRWDEELAYIVMDTTTLAQAVDRAVQHALRAGAGDHVSLAATVIRGIMN